MSQLKVDRIVPVSGVPTGGGGGIIQITQTTNETTTTVSYTHLTLPTKA